MLFCLKENEGISCRLSKTIPDYKDARFSFVNWCIVFKKLNLHKIKVDSELTLTKQVYIKTKMFLR